MRTLIVFILLFNFSVGFSQQMRIRVVDEKGSPIAEAVVNGTNKTTITDREGYFNGAIFLNDSLITVTHIAYLPMKIKVKEMLAKKKIILRKKVFRTKEVKINSKHPIEETSIKIDEKLQSKYSAIVDAIRNETPLFVKDYGGYAGLKTVSFRGLSSETTLVLFNEARVNDLRSGAFNFANVGINSLDEIVFNENSLDGNISAGGVINLISGVTSNKNNAMFGYSYSNLKSQQIYGKGNYNYGKLSASVNFERSFSPNEFPYKFEGKTLRRANAFYDKDFLSGSLIYSSEKLFAKIYAHYSSFKNGLPGFVVNNNTNSSKATSENVQRLIVTNLVATIDKNITYKNVLSYNSSSMAITDTSSDLLINRNYEKARMSGWVFNNNLLFDYTWLKISAGADFSGDKLNSLSPSFLGSIPYSASRFMQNYYLKPRVNFGKIFYAMNLFTGFTLSYVIDNKKIISANSFNQYPSWIAYVEAINSNKNLDVKFSYSSSYRIPTFTELYYSEMFTPNRIKAEKYTDFNFSIRYSVESFSTKISLFNIYGKNKIVWMPTRLALQVPKNIKTIKSRGFELQIQKEIVNPEINFRLIYSFTDIRNLSAQSSEDNSYNKILVYSPKHQIKAGVDFTYGIFYSSVNYSLVSERYYTSDNNPRYVLPLYNLFDLTFALNFKAFGVSNNLSLNIYNAFNESYFVIQSYPMPLRTFRLSYSVNLL